MDGQSISATSGGHEVERHGGDPSAYHILGPEFSCKQVRAVHCCHTIDPPGSFPAVRLLHSSMDHRCALEALCFSTTARGLGVQTKRNAC
ncbi:hypothetical protein ANO11243_063710 [Dothideomycetidae sp. 11243]|nr:hypothetical protein ANO11243_063710 [fungal sp. No.11243]